jgi:hypothetical protein
VADHPKVFHHVGLLVNEPPGAAGLLFIKSSEEFAGESRFGRDSSNTVILCRGEAKAMGLFGRALFFDCYAGCDDHAGLNGYFGCAEESQIRIFSARAGPTQYCGNTAAARRFGGSAGDR